MISFSLFGTRPHYLRGALENVAAAGEIYPGWQVRVYCAADVPVETVADLALAGAQVRTMPRAPGGQAMCWRFLPAADQGLERVIFRDADSILNPREAEAVAEWVESGLPFHCMHDHEHHRSWPVFGGMWGCLGGALPDMPGWISGWPRPWNERLDDMKVLRDLAHPLMLRAGVLRHSSVAVEWPAVPFPAHEAWDGFVGQQRP